MSAESYIVPPEPWPALVPFDRPKPPHLDLGNAIPDSLADFRAFMHATAEALQVPVDAVAPLAIGIVSLAASRSFEVTLSKSWVETAPLWIVVLAEPGERKSALLSTLTKPLHEWQADERAHLKPALTAYAETRKTCEARLNGIRAKISRAKLVEVATLEKDAAALSHRLASMPELAAPELVTSNATPEAMRDLLCRNGEKLALVSAETDAGQLMGSRYGNGGANVDLFLAAFTGDPSPSHRVGRDLPLARPALALCLCVQPQALADVLRDPVARGRGLVDRMALIRPASRMGSRALTPDPVSMELRAAWSDTLRRILNCPWPGRVTLHNEAPTRCGQSPRALMLDGEAHATFCALRAEIESKLGECGGLRPISGFASKLPGVVARLALAFEVMRDTNADTVTGPSMRAAVVWAPFLVGHFRAVLGDAGESQERRHARRLVATIVRQGIRELSARECFNLIDGSEVPNMAEFQPILDDLIAANYLRSIGGEENRQKMRGRPASPRFEVNPAAYATT